VLGAGRGSRFLFCRPGVPLDDLARLLWPDSTKITSGATQTGPKGGRQRQDGSDDDDDDGGEGGKGGKAADAERLEAARRAEQPPPSLTSLLASSAWAGGVFQCEADVRKFCRLHGLDGTVRIGRLGERQRRRFSSSALSASSGGPLISVHDLSAEARVLFQGFTFLLSGFDPRPNPTTEGSTSTKRARGSAENASSSGASSASSPVSSSPRHRKNLLGCPESSAGVSSGKSVANSQLTPWAPTSSEGFGGGRSDSLAQLTPWKEDVKAKIEALGGTVVDDVLLPTATQVSTAALTEPSSKSSKISKSTSSRSSKSKSKDNGVDGAFSKSSKSAAQGKKGACQVVDFLVSTTRAMKRLKYVRCVAAQVPILHWSFLDDCLRDVNTFKNVRPSSSAVVPGEGSGSGSSGGGGLGSSPSTAAAAASQLGQYMLPLGFSHEKEVFVFPPTSSQPTDQPGHGSGNGSGPVSRAKRGSSGGSLGAGGSSLALKSSGFAQDPLKGMVLRVVGRSKASVHEWCQVLSDVGATPVPTINASTASSLASFSSPAAGTKKQKTGASSAKRSERDAKGKGGGGGGGEEEEGVEEGPVATCDAQLCDAGALSTEVSRLIDQHPNEKVLSLEWVIQCILHRRRVDDADYTLRQKADTDPSLQMLGVASQGKKRSSLGAGCQATSAKLRVHRVQTSGANSQAVRFEVGEFVAYLKPCSNGGGGGDSGGGGGGGGSKLSSKRNPLSSPSSSSSGGGGGSWRGATTATAGATNVAYGQILDFPLTTPPNLSSASSLLLNQEGESAAAGSDGKNQLVRLKELRPARSGKSTSREFSRTHSAVTCEIRAEQLLGRVLVLQKADFESRVWAAQSPDVFFFA